MSVAKKRRGWPAWGSSLSNGTGARVQIFQSLWAPNPACQERQSSGRTRTHSSFCRACLSVPACLGSVSCSPGFQTEVCCTSFSHPHRQDEPV